MNLTLTGYENNPGGTYSNLDITKRYEAYNYAVPALQYLESTH
jgi:hypothetical protein